MTRDEKAALAASVQRLESEGLFLALREAVFSDVAYAVEIARSAAGAVARRGGRARG